MIQEPLSLPVAPAERQIVQRKGIEMTDETDEQKARRLHTQLTEVLKAWERRSPSASDMATDVLEMVAEALKAESLRVAREIGGQAAAAGILLLRLDDPNDWQRAVEDVKRYAVTEEREARERAEHAFQTLHDNTSTLMEERDAANDLLRTAAEVAQDALGHLCLPNEKPLKGVERCAEDLRGLGAAIAAHLKGGDASGPTTQIVGAVTQPGADEGSGLSPRDALTALVKRLDEVHADSHYQSVWQLYMIHGGNYTNWPKYDKELEAARKALTVQSKREFVGSSVRGITPSFAKRVGLERNGEWGPSADPRYEMWELADAVENWLKLEVSAALKPQGGEEKR